MYGEDASDEKASLSNSTLVARISSRKPDRVTLETCVCVSALALGCVMAGTGDLESLKIIRSLYFKVVCSSSVLFCYFNNVIYYYF